MCIGGLPTYNYLFPSLFSDLTPKVICIPVFTDNLPDAPKAPKEAKPWEPFLPGWCGVVGVIHPGALVPYFGTVGNHTQRQCDLSSPKKENPGFSPRVSQTTTTKKDELPHPILSQS